MLFGYARRKVGESGELELREISFGTTPETLREIARFLQLAADEMEVASDRPWRHWHIDSFIEDWRAKHPTSDIVVVDLESYP